MLPHYVVALLWLATLPFWFWNIISGDDAPLGVSIVALAAFVTLGIHFVVDWRKGKASHD
jgi:hypothetical protein